MKRKTEKIPGFDEIIFENKNKEYGAYDLRKRYNATTSLSILSGVTLCTTLVLLFAMKSEPTVAHDDGGIIVLIDPFLPPPDVPEPETRKPAGIEEIVKNMAPVVTDDTTDIFIPPPTAEELLGNTKDKPVNDSLEIFRPVDPIIPEEDDNIRIFVKEMPEFPGGIPELMKFISKNLSYPEDAVRNNIQGRVVLKFVVRPDGTVGRTEILAGADSLLNIEAIRVVKKLPAFKPGKQDGVAVPVWFTIPVLFRLENN